MRAPAKIEAPTAAHVPCSRLFSISSLCGRCATPGPTFARTARDAIGRLPRRPTSVSSSVGYGGGGVCDDDGGGDTLTSWYPLRGEDGQRRQQNGDRRRFSDDDVSTPPWRGSAFSFFRSINFPRFR